jgi:hypothetical protein
MGCAAFLNLRTANANDAILQTKKSKKSEEKTSKTKIAIQ